jgi:YHS domain-containing protein
MMDTGGTPTVHDPGEHPMKTDPPEPTVKSGIVPKNETEQTICPVMGNPINKDVFVEYQGKKVYFCCPGCIEPFQKNPEKYLPKLPQFKQTNE